MLGASAGIDSIGRSAHGRTRDTRRLLRGSTDISSTDFTRGSMRWVSVADGEESVCPTLKNAMLHPRVRGKDSSRWHLGKLPRSSDVSGKILSEGCSDARSQET